MAAGARHAPQFEAADITDIPALQAAIAALRARTGPILALLNNAANDKRHLAGTCTVERWDTGIAVNLRHQFFAAQAVLPDMKARASAPSSISARSAGSCWHGNMPAYTSNKAGCRV